MTRSSAEAWSTAGSPPKAVRVLVRLAAITLAGAVLYYAGAVNALVIVHPSPVGALPLFACVALARMSAGELAPELARASGALTLFALRARIAAVCGRAERPASAPAAAA